MTPIATSATAHVREAPSPPWSIALAVVVHAPGGVAMPVPFVIAETGEDAARFTGG
jgi:hypothetical protein